MKRRHAAAIALVGWYLMTAPVSDQRTIIYQDAPLSQWEKAESFDSESHCEAKRRVIITDSQEAVALAPNSEVDEDTRQGAANAFNQAVVSRCVAADDPALGNNTPRLGPGLLKKLTH
ncbi:MAG: hypothetical protein WBQ86_10765 [Candidatus Binatus sp.]